jgi:hypothetical protein
MRLSKRDTGFRFGHKLKMKSVYERAWRVPK